MTRPKPKSTIEDLMLFMFIGMVFTRMSVHDELHPVVQLMFVLVFFVLAVLKLRKDKKEGKPPGKAYAMAGFSLAVIIALGYVIADTGLMERGN